MFPPAAASSMRGQCGGRQPHKKLPARSIYPLAGSHYEYSCFNRHVPPGRDRLVFFAGLLPLLAQHCFAGKPDLVAVN